jgi:hypothetical protein
MHTHLFSLMSTVEKTLRTKAVETGDRGDAMPGS